MWLPNVLDNSLVLMPISNFRWLSRAVGLTSFFLFRPVPKEKSTKKKKSHWMSLNLMCLSCLKTFHFTKFWVGRLICAPWQVNDYRALSVIFSSFYFAFCYLCRRYLDTRHHKKINLLSSTQLSPREAVLRRIALSFFWGYDSFLLLLTSYKCFIAKRNEYRITGKDQ